jgi:hypothetical protein
MILPDLAADDRYSREAGLHAIKTADSGGTPENLWPISPQPLGFFSQA